MSKGMESLKIKVDVTRSAGKLGRYMDVVKTGCGAHRSVKDYNRQAMKQKCKNEVRDE